MGRSARIISLTIAAAMLILELCSCGLIMSEEKVRDIAAVSTYTAEGTSVPVIPSAPSGGERTTKEFDPISPLSVFPDYDYGGRYFTLLTLEGDKLFCDDEIFQGTSRALVRALELKYGLSLYHVTYGEEELLSEIGKLFESGKYFADAAILPYKYLSAMVSAGYLSTFENKAFYIPELGCYDSDTVEMMKTEDGHIYALYSRALYDPRESICVFFDRASFDAEALYSSVSAGKWTNKALKDAASGKSVTIDPRAEGLCKELLPGADITGEHGDITAFKEGKTQIAIAPISAIEQLVGCERAFGILPLPKEDESGRYFSYCGDIGDIPVLMCPAEPASHDSSMLMIASLCAASGDGYTEAALAYYRELVRDNGSYYMLDYIFSDIRIDPVQTVQPTDPDDPGDSGEEDPESGEMSDPEDREDTGGS